MVVLYITGLFCYKYPDVKQLDTSAVVLIIRCNVAQGYLPSATLCDTVTSSYLSLVSSGLGFVVLFKPQPQLPWIFIVAFLTNWLQIDLIELCFQVHLLVAGGAGKVIHAPGFVQGCKHITLDHLVTGVAKVAKKLMVVSLAESQTFSLVMPVSKEWFLTLGTHEVFHMPMFAQSCDHSLLYRPPACPTDGDAHLVVAA